MDVRLETQRGEKANPLVRAFRDQVLRLPAELFRDPLARLRPYDFYMRWRNGRTMVDYVGKVLDERFAQVHPETNVAGQRRPRRRAVIDLALDAYQAQGNSEGGKAVRMDAEFRTFAISQIRTFIFAGHDTTSSTICYALHMLQKHPDCLARIRKEHDDILGDVASTPDVIKRDAHVLNRLEYTTAVIRETLRLWPPASSARQGQPGFMIRDPETNETYPTEDCLVWIVSYAMHRSPKVWGETATKFEPTRFLRNKDKIPDNGYRPFELGPRNCIGQELAMIESRVILALVVRRFDFSTAYDRLDELKNDGSHYATDPKWRRGRQDLDGEAAYQILLGSAKPREVSDGLTLKIPPTL